MIPTDSTNDQNTIRRSKYQRWYFRQQYTIKKFFQKDF